MFGSTFPLPFVFNSSFFSSIYEGEAQYRAEYRSSSNQENHPILKKYSKWDQRVVIVSTKHLQDENRIFRTSIQKHFQNLHFYCCIVSLDLLFYIGVLGRCVIEFTRISKQN